MLDLLIPLVGAGLYLITLIGISELVERRADLTKLAQHPITYSLALGVYATSWTFYGSVGFASRFGYDFLAISLGVVLSCLAIPVLWRPLARIVHKHNLTSVADLVAFRFQSPMAGALVTLFMLIGLMPYFSLQMRAISGTAGFITGGAAPAWASLVYALLLVAFAATLGVRYADPRFQRPGLLATLAVESLVKLGAITMAGAIVLFGVFDGFSDVDEFLRQNPDLLHQMYAPVRQDGWLALLSVAFFAAFLLPRQFHVAFVERPSDRHLRHTMWALPLLLGLMNLPLPLLYWAGSAKLSLDVSPDHYVLASIEHPLARLIVFIGGLSAASAMLLVSSMALSEMVVKHLVVPLRSQEKPLSYSRVVIMRRVVIAALLLFGVLLEANTPAASGLVDLGLISFAAVLQLVPGVLAVLFWDRATMRGFIIGLIAGGLVWVDVIAAPWLGLGGLHSWLLSIDPSPEDIRTTAIGSSIALNAMLFVGVSLLCKQRNEERAAADTLILGTARWDRAPETADELVARVGRALGASSAEELIERARASTELSEIKSLSQAVERELSEVVGPLRAQWIVSGDQHQRARAGTDVATELDYWRTRDDSPPESATERSLQLVRAYLDELIEAMPLGLCTFDASARVIVWNNAMEQITGASAQDTRGQSIPQLPAPWGEVLGAHIDPQVTTSTEHEVMVRDGSSRVVSVRRAPWQEERGVALLIEDITTQRHLEAQVIHKDRLATLGRLAAGVAHEVGNPLAGMMMVARNVAREREDEELEERLGLIEQEGKRIEEIVRALLVFGRKEPVLQPKSEDVEFGALLHDAIRLVKLNRHAKELEWVIEIEDDLHVTGDPDRLRQVFINLLTNACDASDHNGQLQICAWRDHDGVLAAIEDRGEGIAEAHAERIFEPFFTTKSGHGSGLGLSISFAIIQDHGGELSHTSANPRGTIMTVRLPDRETT